MRTAPAKEKQIGLWASNDPVDVGGLGMSMVDYVVFAEAVGRSPPRMTVSDTQAPDAGNVEILRTYGTANRANGSSDRSSSARSAVPSR